MKQVSVVIPVYNNERYVEKCIVSVLEQTYRELEILAIDDGSTDQSGAILDRLAKSDGRVRVFHQENRGVSAARNRGIDAAGGEYLTFVDGDDFLGPTYIADFVDCAEQNRADMVFCGFCVTDTEGRVTGRTVPGEYRKGEKEEWLFRISAVCAHFYRRELWERYRVRFAPGVRGEDMPVALFFSAACDRIAVLPKAEYYYVQHSSSARHNFRGLKTYDLPLQALEQTVRTVCDGGLDKGDGYFELFVLRILATCFFELCPGASSEKKREFCRFSVNLLETYFPRYYRSPKARLTAPLEVPFYQKAAVKLFVFLVRTRLLYPVSRLLNR